MRLIQRPIASYLSLLRMGGRIQGIGHGLFSLQARASRLQMGVARRPMDIDQAFQAQRLRHRK